MSSKKIDLTDVKVDDEVKSVLNDWGTVCVVGKKLINVKYPNGICGTYYYDGRCNEADLYPEIVAVRKKKWEPEGGQKIIRGRGSILEPLTKDEKEYFRQEGRAYPNEELAEKAYSLIRPYQRLVAWILEHAPNNDFENGEYTVTHDFENNWYYKVVIDVRDDKDIGAPRISSHKIAEKLAYGLNEGIIKL